jgi:CBS domain-containing protein
VGDKNVLDTEGEAELLRSFTKRVLRDVQALERMIRDGCFEEGVRRIGAEQEVFLVDRDFRPAPSVLKMIEILKDPHFVTEVALFNLEMNLDPQPWGGKCLSAMEDQLLRLLAKAREAARSIGNEIVLTGILPTIRKSDLGLENMTPIPRYFALNKAMTKLRGGDYEVHLKGVDELHAKHDNVMLESCNTSFQCHLQVGAKDFAKMYNIAQVAAAPVLAAATNSPLLFGRRLWNETRVALFQQSVDTRGSSAGARDVPPRVDFGRQWVKESAVELFRENIARYRVLIAADPDEDPMDVLDKGGIPSLSALRLHNGTIYRWNRACCGITNGKPHIRIEARSLPSGPTPVDEVANAAFWYGLVIGLAAKYEDITQHIAFDDARGNFFSAARLGLGAQFTWLDGVTAPAQQIVLEMLVPMAREALLTSGIDRADVDRYIGVFAERVSSGHTGSNWALRSYSEMRTQGTEGERINALTAAMIRRQQDNKPVARWDVAQIREGGGWKHNYVKVEQFMGTDFVTVHENDPLDLALNLMIWERVRHIPVEDDQHRLVGLVSYRAVLRATETWFAGTDAKSKSKTIPVSEVMKRDPWTVSPDTSTLVAIQVIRQKDVGCLPVVTAEQKLVGMVTSRNLLGVASELLEQKLRE